MKTFLAWLSLVLACSVAGSAQEELTPPPCHLCKRTGFIENKAWKKASLERDGLLCAAFIQSDESGRGLRSIPCPRCGNDPAWKEAREEFAAEVARREKWLAERMQVNELCGSDLVHLQTEHFLLSFGIEKVTVGRKIFRKHEAAHLYLDRLESVFQDFTQRLDATFDDMNRERHWVLLFDDQKAGHTASLHYLGMRMGAGSKKLGLPSIFCGWWDRGKTPTDTDLHRYVVHNVVHLLLATLDGYDWLGLQGRAGWLDEGLAHYYEVAFFPKQRGATFCYQEVNTLRGWTPGSWPVAMRKLMERGEVPLLAAIESRASSELDREQHLAAWSWVEFLLATAKKGQFRALVSALKQKMPLAEALRKTYGMNLTTFQDAWKDHVLATYPRRE
jgi:hypothetical protein